MSEAVQAPRKKILHILNSRVYSGAEVIASQIILAFSDRAELVYCSPESEAVDWMLGKLGIRHTAVKSLTPWALAKVIRREKPDLIHAHDMRACFFSAIAGGRIPVLFHIHNNAINARKISLKSLGFALGSLRAKHIFWVSQGAMECYRFSKLVARKSSVLRNVVDDRAIRRKMLSDPNRHDYDIVYCGRLAPEKDPLRLIRVCARVKQEKPDLKVAILGEGELAQDCRALAAQLGLENNVFFLGYRDNPMGILRDTRLIALTSLWEGCGLVVLEGMALGTPAVCTDVDGLKNILLDGQTGLLGRTDEELAACMLRILNDPQLREALGQNAKAHFADINDIDGYNRVLAQYYGV